MTYKRQMDRLPIIPKDAKEFNVTCHYCIVGCGYKAYTWAANKQGGTAPAENKFNADAIQTAASRDRRLVRAVHVQHRQPERAGRAHRDQAGPRVRGELRTGFGPRCAHGRDESKQRNTELQRLTDPMVWRYGQMQPTSWADALDLVARVTVAVINDMGEDGLFVSAFDHGGAGGGYENTWAPESSISAP